MQTEIPLQLFVSRLYALYLFTDSFVSLMHTNRDGQSHTFFSHSLFESHFPLSLFVQVQVVNKRENARKSPTIKNNQFSFSAMDTRVSKKQPDNALHEGEKKKNSYPRIDRASRVKISFLSFGKKEIIIVGGRKKDISCEVQGCHYQVSGGE